MKAKRFLLMLLVALVSVTGAWAQQEPFFYSLTPISGNPLGATTKGDYTYRNVFVYDGDGLFIWVDEVCDNMYIEFQTDAPVEVNAYYFNTCRMFIDGAANPLGWTLLGKESQNDEWEILSKVEDNVENLPSLPGSRSDLFYFTCDNGKKYMYFRLNISGSVRGEYIEIDNFFLGKACVHQYSDDIESGEAYYTCNRCGYVNEERRQGHTHVPAAEWRYDRQTHWHDCVGEDLHLCSTPKLDLALHHYSDNREDGASYYTCECGYKNNERYHVHHYAEDWSNDTFSHWHECTSQIGNCLERRINSGDHQYTTNREDGTSYYTCSVCGYVDESRSHIHQKADEWSNDETHHWHNCLGTIGICEEQKQDFEEHHYSNNSADGSSYYTCSACGYIDEIRRHVHQYTSWSYDETQHWRTCTSDIGTCNEKSQSAEHSYAENREAGALYYTCAICGHVDETRHHVHHYANWSYDKTQHWGTCINGTGICTETTYKEAHDFTEKHEEGMSYYVCTVCGYEEIAKNHFHLYSEKWSYNQTQHWQACIGKEGVCKHPKQNTDSHHFASNPSDGEAYYTCAVCGYKDESRDHVHKYVLRHNNTQHWHECIAEDGICTHRKTNLGNHAYVGTSNLCDVCGFELHTEGQDKKNLVQGIVVTSAIPEEGMKQEEDCSKVFDGFKDTKWRASVTDNMFIEFKTDCPILVAEYYITTGNENVTIDEFLYSPAIRNPKGWVLKGKTNENDDWEILSVVAGADKNLPHTACTRSQAFPISGSDGKRYMYFRYEFSGAVNGSIFEIGEISLANYCNHEYSEEISSGSHYYTCSKCGMTDTERYNTRCNIAGHDFSTRNDVCDRCGHGFFFYEAGAVMNPTVAYALKGANGKALTIVNNTCENGQGIIEFAEPLVTIGDNAFDGCTALTGNLVIGNSVKTIGAFAFHNCNALSGTLVLGNSVTTIGERAFDNCTGLQGNLIIPDCVESIGKHAFNSCTGFNGTVKLSNSLTRIEDFTFYQCNNLTGNLTIPNGVEYVGRYAFYGCTRLDGDFTLGNSVNTISESAFAWCSGLTGNITIPSSVQSIEDYAFAGCRNLSGDLVIPNSVQSIGNYAFRNCSGFDGNLSIGNSVQTIGKHAFDGCAGFTGNVIIGSSVKSIGEQAFTGCSNLSGDLIIPNSVQSIGNYAFDGCSALTGTLTLSEAMTKIGEFAFAGCNHFSGTLVIPNSVEEIEKNAFKDFASLSGITFGSSLKSIGEQAFAGCSNLSGGLVIPNSVQSIGNYAFDGCTGFTGNVIIGSSVESIGDYAFAGCSNLSGDLIIPNSVQSIGDYAFNGCSTFDKIVIGSSVKSIGTFAFGANPASMKVLAQNPPSLKEKSLGENYETMIVHVPIGTLSAYSASDWSSTRLFNSETLEQYVIDLYEGRFNEEHRNRLNESKEVIENAISADIGYALLQDSKVVFFKLYRNDQHNTVENAKQNVENEYLNSVIAPYLTAIDQAESATTVRENRDEALLKIAILFTVYNAGLADSLSRGTDANLKIKTSGDIHYEINTSDIEKIEFYENK